MKTEKEIKEMLTRRKAENICTLVALISIEAVDLMMKGYDLNEI